MYKLLKPISNGLNLFVEELQSHITRIGLESVKELKGDNVYFFILFLNKKRTKM